MDPVVVFWSRARRKTFDELVITLVVADDLVQLGQLMEELPFKLSDDLKTMRARLLSAVDTVLPTRRRKVRSQHWRSTVEVHGAFGFLSKLLHLPYHHTTHVASHSFCCLSFSTAHAS